MMGFLDVFNRRDVANFKLFQAGGRGSSPFYPGTEEAHTNPTRQRGECLRALAGASG